jgi:hypothetical protein
VLLLARDGEASIRRRWRSVEGRIMPALFDYVAHTWGKEFIAYAWDELLSFPDEPVDFNDAPELHSTFEPWLLSETGRDRFGHRRNTDRRAAGPDTH